MAGQLTDDFMDQLEQWIGTGPKKFDMLYAITRDGCDPKIFHQKCDNQGPNVTVLYNQHNSVYGAYTSVSWTSPSGQFVSDSSAFLFQLQFNGKIAANKFPCKNAAQAVIHKYNYGPIFGRGYGLCSFCGALNSSGGLFALNGNMDGFNTDYNSQGYTASQINNGTMHVTELEVYKVIGM